MVNLVYNIDFELVSFVFTLFLYVETYIHYPRHTKKNKLFRTMTLLVLASQLFDMISAITITYAAQLPSWLNILINSAFFMCGLLLCFLFHYYVCCSLVPPEGKDFLIKTNRIILLITELSFVLNMFFGFIFSFSDGAYIHGPLYLMPHGISLWFLACASLSLIVNRKLLKKSQILSGSFFIAFYLLAIILQAFFFPNILIIMPMVTCMLIVGIFSLESPDYVYLQKTLSTLTETQKELEKANRKYYTLAYTDVMTDTGNRAAYYARLEQIDSSENRENAIIMIADINDMKNLNDCFGHLIGDEAIIRTAKLIRNRFPQADSCYRIGGDEFAVVLSDISEEGFAKALNSFRDSVSVENEKVNYPFSVACGYSRLGTGSLQDALSVADRNMYQNKVLIKQQQKQ